MSEINSALTGSRPTAVRAALSRGRLILQLAATAAALGWVPGNAAKLAVMLAVWAVGFGRISGTELLAMGGVNLLFAAMDWGALAKGVFRFEHPDLLGLPAYEYLMWGFYTLHALRLLGGAPPRDRRVLALAVSAIFTVPFLTIADPTMLSITAGLALAAALAVFHEKLDFAFTGYMIAVGALIEYVGTGTGQWSYPGAPYGGVPIWSAAMWGGVGLFTRRLLQPLVYRKAAQPEAPGKSFL